MNSLSRLAVSISLACAFPLTAYAADAPADSKGTVEVVHWWTSGGEKAAVDVLKAQVEKDGFTWKDGAVAGGGGATAMTVLKSRAVAGNPPGMAQIKGPDIQEWASTGLLDTDVLKNVAKDEKWDSLLDKKVSDTVKYEGNYVAVPVNIHRVNWLWINPAVFKKPVSKKPRPPSKNSTPPATSSRLPVLFRWPTVASLGRTARCSKPWCSRSWVSMATKALVELDDATLTGPQMVKALTELKKVATYMDADGKGQDWNLEAGKVINGKAGMQIMGDWAKSEWTAAKKVAGKDYECVPFPGTDKAFTYNIDSLAVFKQKDKGTAAGQQDIAKVALGEDFQKVFSINKGSIPVRIDMLNDMNKYGFDSCAQTAAKDFLADAKSGGLQPSMAHNMATTLAVQGAFFDVVTNYINDPKADPVETAKKLGAAVKSAK